VIKWPGIRRGGVLGSFCDTPMQIERVLVAARLSRDVEEVRRVLAGLGEAVKVEQARSREELRSLIEEKEPDLVVVFHPFPAFHGRDTSALVKKMAPGARVVLVAKDDSSAGDLACSGDGNPSVLPKDHLCDLATMAGLPAPQSAAWGGLSRPEAHPRQPAGDGRLPRSPVQGHLGQQGHLPGLGSEPRGDDWPALLRGMPAHPPGRQTLRVGSDLPQRPDSLHPEHASAGRRRPSRRSCRDGPRGHRPGPLPGGHAGQQ